MLYWTCHPPSPLQRGNRDYEPARFLVKVRRCCSPLKVTWRHSALACQGSYARVPPLKGVRGMTRPNCHNKSFIYNALLDLSSPWPPSKGELVHANPHVFYFYYRIILMIKISDFNSYCTAIDDKCYKICAIN